MPSKKTYYSFTLRVKIFSVFVTLCLMGLAGALFNVQILGGANYKTLSQNNRVRRIYVPAQRGKIFDRKGNLFVDNRPSYNVEITREEIRDKKKLIRDLAQILGMSEKEITNRLSRNATFSYMPVPVRRDIDEELLVKVEENSYMLPAVDINVNPVRSYIHNEIGAHIFGIVGKIPEAKVDAYLEKGYKRDDAIGRDGLEAQYEEYLRGKGGGMQVQVDSRGIKDQVLGYIPPEPGADLHLTIDRDIQYELTALYADKIGAGVVMNYRTGEILAMGSFPAFDPNMFVRPLTHQQFEQVYLNPNSPLTDRAIAGLYPPGSVFKPIVAIAALSSGVIDETRSAFCNGEFYLGDVRFRCWKKTGHGRVTVVDAIKHSCNVFFYNLSLAVGEERIHDYAAMLHCGRRTGVDLPGEQPGVLPNRAWKREKLREDWFGGETVNYAIGQGYVLVTPIQVCVYTGALATGGRIMVPRVCDRLVASDGTEVFRKKDEVSEEVQLNAKALSLVYEGMRRVVQDPDGTGRRAFVEGLDIRGKTGTAEFSRRNERIKCTWFTAFILSDAYPLSVTLLVEEGVSGGTTCAPMVKDLVEKTLEVYNPT